MQFGLYAALGDDDSAARLCEDLAAFSAAYPDPGSNPVSFVAMFKQSGGSESAFADSLWDHLQAMHDVDRERHAWDPTVSAQSDDEAFSFSVAGRAFFVVGLSPAASRLARRAPFPCLVFNFHDQFATLKANGKYAGLQKATRVRDVALQGSINPMLAGFGDASEARQYAGNVLSDGWVCPFSARAASHVD